MKLEELQKSWEDFGTDNPLWAVHTGADEWTEEDFFQTGRQEIDGVFTLLEELDADPPHGRALDFGCGTGRLSLPLARRFDRVDGVDISAPMVKQAETYRDSAEGIDPATVHFHVNVASDLALFEDATFDFVLSLIVLQHMKPEYSGRYITEFCRLVKPGGTLLFQIPARRESAYLRARGTVARKARQLRHSLGRGDTVMEMYGTPRERVQDLIESSGLELVAVIRDNRAATWESYTYVARRA